MEIADFKNYFLGLSEAERERLVQHIETIKKDLWSKGFSLGMIAYVGNSIQQRALNEINGSSPDEIKA